MTTLYRYFPRITKLSSFTRPPAWTTNPSGFYTTSSSSPPRTTSGPAQMSSRSGWSGNVLSFILTNIFFLKILDFHIYLFIFLELHLSTTIWTTSLSVRLNDSWSRLSPRLIPASTRRDSKLTDSKIFSRQKFWRHLMSTPLLLKTYTDMRTKSKDKKVCPSIRKCFFVVKL